MKKLLLLLAGLLFAVLPSKAQNGYTVDLNNPIKETKDFIPGDYVIYCQATGKPSGFLFYKEGDNGRPFRFNNGINIASGYISNAYYVWTVEEVEENGKKLYTFTNKQDNSKYLLKDNKWNQNMSISADKEIAKFEAVQFTDDNEFKSIALKLPERITPPEGTANADPYIFCNADGDPNLSYWGSDNPKGAVHFTFYPATPSSSAPEYPFVLSDAPVNGKFSENTYWYYLKLNNKYLSYNDVIENYNYKQNNYKEQKYVYTYDSNPLTYGCFWAFVKDGEDLKIYNAATGASMVLASDGSDERDFYPTMMVPGTENYTCAWHYKVAPDATKFYLFLQGTGNYENSENKLNCYGGDGENLKNYLTFSTGAGAYSYFTVELIDIPAAITSVRNTQKAITGAVGTLNSESYANFTAALDKGTIEGLTEALKIRDISGQKVQFKPNTYYRLLTLGRTPYPYMTINAENVTGAQLNTTNSSQIWKLIGNEESGYKMNCQGRYMTVPTKADNSYVVPTTNVEEAGLFNLIPKTNSPGKFYFDPVGAGYNLHMAGELKIVGWDSGEASEWYLIEAPSIDITISNVGYATVNYPFAVQLPEDGSISAYIGTVIENNNSTLLLKKISNGLIPANTPVVLEGVKGEEKTYTLTIVTDDASTNPEENVLKGTLLPEAISEEAFILGVNEETVGFYKLNPEENTVGANKAYLPKSVLPKLPAGVKGVTFSFDDNSGETTGIEDATINLAEEEFYDLQGRRIMNPTKGIYVTKSGKKVLFTK